MEERIRIGGRTIFVTNIVLWSLMLVALILAFVGEKLASALRGLLVVCCLLLLVVGLALLYYLWGTVALSGTCGLTREIMNENKEVLNEIDASPEFRDVLNKCFYRVDSRSLTVA